MPLPLLWIAGAVAAAAVGATAMSGSKGDAGTADDDAESLRREREREEREQEKARAEKWARKSLRDLAARHPASGRRARLPRDIIATAARTADLDEALAAFLPRKGATDAEKEVAALEVRAVDLRRMREEITAAAQSSGGRDGESRRRTGRGVSP